MTNKGQSLVIFVLLLPVIFILITLVWELGNLSYVHIKYESEIKNIINYGLKNIYNPDIETKINELLDVNLKGEKALTIKENTIKISVKDEYKTVYRMIFKDRLNIDITYTGNIDNGKITIKKE